MSRRERLLGVLYATPRSPEVDNRKQRFEELNAFVSARGDAWLVSVPAAHELRLDALVGSPIPNDLRALGYIVEKIGTSERILAQAMTVKFTTRADGELEALTEGSTKPVTTRSTHAGIASVEQYDLRMP